MGNYSYVTEIECEDYVTKIFDNDFIVKLLDDEMRAHLKRFAVSLDAAAFVVAAERRAEGYDADGRPERRVLRAITFGRVEARRRLTVSKWG